VPPVVETHVLGPTQTNCYVVRADPAAQQAVVIDPGFEGFEPGHDVAAILITHTHYDHIGAVAELATATRAPVYVPRGEREVLAHADQIYGALGVDVRPWTGDAHELTGDDQLELAGIGFETASVPGHSPDHLAYYAEPYLFSGDVLFAGSVGRVDLPGGSWDDMLRSLRDVVLPLDDTTVVLPGHGPATTIGRERAGNPYLAEAAAGGGPAPKGRGL
jgi:hydroxyacylglutathione hydrolase